MSDNLNHRAYQRATSAVFRKTKEKYGGLSNMAGGFPLYINGIRIRTSEALYQACRFPHLPEVQRLIIDQASPMTAKMKGKPHRKNSRKDWYSVRVKIMRWCLRAKLAQNWESFRALLLSTGGKPIVEDSKRDTFWGAKPVNKDTFSGANVLGRLLMELRELLKGPEADSLRIVSRLNIPNFSLLEQEIGVVGSSDGLYQEPSVTEAYDYGAPIAEIAGQVHEAPVKQTFAKDQRESDGVSRYPKRLIEVDLPIKKISEHARNEKNLRSGHPWHLHIWWARRPWGACRSVELASLLPDPVDSLCPPGFISEAADILAPLGYRPKSSSKQDLRKSLLRFIGDLAEWKLGASELYHFAAKSLVKAAYPQTAPVVFDSFAGNGAIPGEALRLGCESIALDLNPVANLELRTLLEAAPRHGYALLDKFREGAEFIKDEAGKRLSQYYPRKEGKNPIAWLWARTVRCEGPGCGATIPLISQTIIAKGRHKAWIQIKGNQDDKTISIHVCKGEKIPPNLIKTAGGGAAVCPVCGFTTPKSSVKRQGKAGQMGHRLYGVALPIGERQGKDYCDTTKEDRKAFDAASQAWNSLLQEEKIHDITEKFPFHDPRAFTAGLYGISEWGDLFSDRQKLTLFTLADVLKDYAANLQKDGTDPALIKDMVTALSLGISNTVHYWTTMSTWLAEHMISAFITGNAIAMRWDWAEGNPLVPSYVGGLEYGLSQAEEGIAASVQIAKNTATVLQGNATEVPLPDDSADMFFTDPPYYDVVPYADLSDLCYVWLKRFVGEHHPDLFSMELTPKAEQIVVNPYAPEDGRGEQTPERYQERMTLAFQEGRRILRPDGIGAIVFAHKGTAAWEALLAAVIDAGFVVTASWPIDTERAARMRANKSAALGSSVHLIVRPCENEDGTVRKDKIGDWRDVLQELPRRIHEWMPRLSTEGIIGADAIFACLGPALEVFSRYSSVEKASGEEVTLKEYLEYVWAAVAKEALNMIFEGADATGFEEDARLTAIWLWTLSTGGNGRRNSEEDSKASTGYMLEYDVVRKIAQGLGAHLERLTSVVEIEGDKARLLPVSERTRYLFGKDSAQAPKGKRKKNDKQMKLGFMAELEEAEESGGFDERSAPSEGKTVLDRLHQCMTLFAAGRGEALKRFLVEEGVGRDQRFWRLAQALSALYPSNVDEKRWVDGVLARKKGLGF